MSKFNIQNCINSNNEKNFNINGFTRMKYDTCAYKKNLSENIAPGNYNLSNFNSCGCDPKNTQEVALSQPKIYYKNGKGWVGMNGCVVDDDSKMRITEGNKITHWKCKNQLATRPYLSVPYMGKGNTDNINLESALKTGEQSNYEKGCDTLKDLRNNNFIPLVPCLKDNIQNPNHLIPDSALKGWVRGGIPSREIVRNIDYMEKCGDLYE